MKKKVIGLQYLQKRFPLMDTLLILLCIDHWQISGIWLGVLYSIIVCDWFESIFQLFMAKASEPIWQDKND